MRGSWLVVDTSLVKQIIHSFILIPGLHVRPHARRQPVQLSVRLRAVDSLPYWNVTLVPHAARQPLCVNARWRITPDSTLKGTNSLALPWAIHDSTRSMRRAALEIARRDISMSGEEIGKPARGIRPGRWELPTPSSNMAAEFENKVSDDDLPQGSRFSFVVLHAYGLGRRYVDGDGEP